MSLTIIVLAAGEGTRMKSKRPKVLHEILGRPMIAYVIDAVRSLKPERVVVVVGHGSDEVAKVLGDGVRIAIQKEQLGTAHAVSQAVTELEDLDGDTLILSGDTPLITRETLEGLVGACRSGAAVAMLTAELPDPFGYGRVVRENDRVARVVEEKDATDEERLINEVNAGTYCFTKEELLSSLSEIKAENAQREYYLTDAIGILASRGRKIVACVAGEPAEALGVNSRNQMAEATGIMRRRINERHMAEGVTIVDPERTYISPGVEIGRDTVIYANCQLEGETSIGEECEIGPNARIRDSRIGREVEIEQAVIKGTVVGDGAKLGPFCHLRFGTYVGPGAKIGGFVEIKKSEIGEDAKVPHLSYIGDAHIGKGANIGAGTITCNFDGFEKHETVVEKDAFIGSDTMLVAPVKIGEGAFTGAGSTITGDVPAGALAVERSEQKNVAGWARKRREDEGKKKRER